ncbi:metal-dependent hydrolase [Pseudomonadota bacterium]|nr:metal-dependent hydrolase [Pseudomonadota bacterium]
MDSISQIVLGGAVAFAVAGKTSPRKALLYGSAIAVLPDLDVFVPYADAISTVTKHRSWSHSLLVQTLAAPILALLLRRIDSVFSVKQWLLLTWLALITHSCLDAHTIYGTQLFWPFMPPPYSGGSVFIIDPLYTIPLLIGFIAVLSRPLSLLSHTLSRLGLILSSIYLVWGLFAQSWILANVKTELVTQGIETDKVLVMATPFNSLLWRVLVIENNFYYEGFRSVFDGDKPSLFKQYDRHPDLIDKLKEVPSLQRLDWFTDGFYSVEKIDTSYIATDLRMGLEPKYFFRYHIAESIDESFKISPAKRFASKQGNKEVLTWVWQRIWTNKASMKNVNAR